MPTAVFLHGPHNARAVPFNLREGRPGKVPLRVGAVGLCGSGFRFYEEGGSGAARIASPFVPGHEVGGWLGSDVPHRRRIALPLGAAQADADVSEIAGWTRGDPDGDICTMPASEARHRAPGVKFARRMGGAYPFAIKPVQSGKVDITGMVTHHPSLADGPAAFAAHAGNEPGRIKTIIHPGS